jgi:hypothetical protein
MLLTRERRLKWSGRRWRKGWLRLVPSAPTRSATITPKWTRATSSSSVRASRASSVTNAKDILETLALLGEGVRISSLSRAKGFKEDTILRWLREAARHSEAVEEVLLGEYRLSKAQVDGLWTYVGNKGQKGATKRRQIAESSGAAR